MTLEEKIQEHLSFIYGTEVATSVFEDLSFFFKVRRLGFTSRIFNFESCLLSFILFFGKGKKIPTQAPVTTRSAEV